MLDASVNVSYTIAQRFLDSSENPATGLSPVVTIYDQATYTLKTTLTMTHRIAGIYTCTYAFPAVGLYDINLDEATVPRHFYATVLVGNSDDVALSSHILNLSNKGQDVTLGAGSGQVTYQNTLTYLSAALPNTEVRAFQAFTATKVGGALGTVQSATMYAKQTSNSLGSFTFYLDPGYYVLQFDDPNDGYNLWYINYDSGTATWTTSTSEINP